MAAFIRSTNVPVTVVLPDSSRAQLQPRSVLRYPPGVPSRRVWLVGGARLSIVPGAPFVVWTETAVLMSAGAVFDVQTVGLETTYVVVRSGAVRLRAQNEDNDAAYAGVTVKAGQRALAARMVGAWIVSPGS